MTFPPSSSSLLISLISLLISFCCIGGVSASPLTMTMIHIQRFIRLFSPC